MMIIGPKSVRLLRSENVTLDAAGAGEVVLGPVPPQQRWHLDRISVRCTVDDPMPTADLYEGAPVADNLMDGTWTGARDTSDLSGDSPLEDGEWLTVRWVGGQAGAVATATIVGRQEIP